MSAYIQQVEALATNTLGQPVSIGSLRVALLPSPRLNVGDVVVGKHRELTIAHISVVPALTSLLSETKVISSLRVIKPMSTKDALNILAGLATEAEGKPSNNAVNVRQIIIKDAKLDWPGMRLLEMNADISLSAESKPEAAKIESVDGQLKFNFIPQSSRQLITLTAKEWILPMGAPLLINQLQMNMVLTESKLEVSKIDGTFYGGKLSGVANLTWGKSYKINGKIKLDNLALHEPATLLTKSTSVSGQLFSSGQYTATAKEPAQLADNLHANFKFNVKDGVLYGFDLAKAPLMLLGQGKGGETKFDEFTGLLGISGKTYQLRNLQISSGLMLTYGAVKINPNKSLNGEVKVEVKNSMKIAAIPLQVSGTLDNPTVFPTKAAIAGAVAGTALLGPVGTGVGIKAGEAIGDLKGLFIGDEK